MLRHGSTCIGGSADVVWLQAHDDMVRLLYGFTCAYMTMLNLYSTPGLSVSLSGQGDAAGRVSSIVDARDDPSVEAQSLYDAGCVHLQVMATSLNRLLLLAPSLKRKLQWRYKSRSF